MASARPACWFCGQRCADHRYGPQGIPLDFYPDEQELDQTHCVNFDPKLYKKLAKHGTPDEVATFEYTYGVLHLMEPAAIGETPYPFKGEGDGVVGKPRFDAGKVWINETQYFEGVPELT